MMADGAPAYKPPVPVPDDPVWEPLRRAAIAAVQLVALEVQRLSHAPSAGDRDVEAVERSNELLDAMNSRLEDIVLDEVLLAQREARAYEAGLAAGAAGRRCGPHRNPGNLRAVSDA